MNKLLDAAKSSKGSNDSSERYRELKKKEAGTSDKDPAKERYEELKEKAKEEYLRKEKEKEERKASEDEEEDSEKFVTY